MYPRKYSHAKLCITFHTVTCVAVLFVFVFILSMQYKYGRKFIEITAIYEPTIKIDIYNTERQNELHFCTTLHVGPGMGNSLSQYWFNRAIAYWNNISFQMAQSIPEVVQECVRTHRLPDIRSHMVRFHDPDSFLFYLPKTSPGRQVESDNAWRRKKIIDTFHLSDLDSQLEDNEKCYMFPHICNLLFFYYNSAYSNVILTDTRNALISENSQLPLETANYDKETPIVIHIRCGDIIKVESTKYGFLTKQYYQLILDQIESNPIFSGLKQKFDSKETVNKVYIISQLNKKSIHNEGDSGTLDECRQLVEGFIDVSLVPVFRSRGYIKDAQDVVLVDYGSIEAHYWRMIESQLFICSMSTFCHHASLAHNYNHDSSKFVLMPMYGPWVYLPDVVGTDINRRLYHDNDVLPFNHVWIDNKPANYTLTSFDIQRLKLRENIPKLIDYLNQ